MQINPGVLTPDAARYISSLEERIRRLEETASMGSSQVFSLADGRKAILNTFDDLEVKIGKLDGALSYQGSATMSEWSFNGSADADTGINETVYDWLLLSGQSIATGTQVVAARAGEQWRVIGAQCDVDSVTSIVGGAGITVDQSTGDVTISIGSDAITNTMIADDAVDTDQIADGAVGTDQIADAAVTAAKIASGAAFKSGDTIVAGTS